MCHDFGDGIAIYREQAQGLFQETLIPFFPPFKEDYGRGVL